MPFDEREAERREVIEEIIDNLRPLKTTKREAEEQVLFHLDWLVHLSPRERQHRRLNPLALRKKYAIIQRSALSIIEAFKALPFPNAHLLFMGFAHDHGPSWKAEESFSRANEELPAFLQELKGLSDTIERDFSSDYDFKTRSSGKAMFAARAYSLICSTAKNQPTGTVDGPYRTIASLLYKAVTGKTVDLKRWCDLEIKAQRGRSTAHLRRTKELIALADRARAVLGEDDAALQKLQQIITDRMSTLDLDRIAAKKAGS